MSWQLGTESPTLYNLKLNIIPETCQWQIWQMPKLSVPSLFQSTEIILFPATPTSQHSYTANEPQHSLHLGSAECHWAQLWPLSASLNGLAHAEQSHLWPQWVSLCCAWASTLATELQHFFNNSFVLGCWDQGSACFF